MYGIQQRRHYYTGTLNVITGWHWVGMSYDQPDEYPTIAAARARIAEMDATIYETAHGEHSRPDYRVRRINPRRSEWVQVRVSPDESDRIAAAAESAGKTVSEYVRDMALRRK